ncbi:CbtA family protein [Smaragdicoccus niigatensis]|uniref:CbtA family protein n=1 Tax=Smaragdicoccus niigatensis TaxID=359359 RepID=UPI00037F87F3|nr:CbtA family protein [Smaragdicoccus niigatensis]
MPLNDRFPTLIIRGLIAGVIAGLLAGVVAFILGEPHIDAAIAIEDAKNAAMNASHEHELVSRTGQRFGLFLATSLAGLALGAIFGTAAHYLRRFSTSSGPIFAMILAVCGWLAIEIVPFFKYPANPPAVGNPETIDHRTFLWLAALILGLLAVSTASTVFVTLRKHGPATRAAATLGAFVGVVAIGYTALPGINEVGADFPATLLWQFRLSSLATQATLWFALGLAFAWLTERANKTSEMRTRVAIY